MKIWFRAIGLGVLAAIAFGIAHDQISVRISPPYLMDWHPKLVESRDPTVVALAWGVVATWWFGLILGAVLAFAATVGKRPPAPWRWIVHSVVFVFVVAALSATVASLVTGAFSLEMPDVFGPVYYGMDRKGRLAFTKVAAMHETSYDAAAIATLLAAILVWRGRKTAPGATPESGGP